MRKKLTVCCTAFLLALSLTVPALAASSAFQDVPETADCYESVMYLAEHEITQGTGNGCFSPDAPVTTSQWAVMLCRAYGVETKGNSWSELSQSAVEQSYRKGWLNETALST
ncbi:MAG: S-layer homology domain-containing protein, partial [Oscillibacter sp.]|nr:S-layer homology domain-containing protein [Oscillibacter sp.]